MTYFIAAVKARGMKLKDLTESLAEFSGFFPLEG